MKNKKPVMLLLSLLIIITSLAASPTYSITQPVGTIAVEVIGIPAGTPAASQLDWSFNGFTENATSSHLHTMANITQQLAPDTNSTVAAGTTTI